MNSRPSDKGVKRERVEDAVTTEPMQQVGLGDDEDLYCTYEGCDRAFSSRWSLKRHIRTHTGERPWICNHCGKQFVQKCSLVRHEQTHNEDKSFICDHPKCDKKFKLKEYLDVHKRTHAKASSEYDSNRTALLNQTSTTSLGLCDQLRQRLVRLTLRHRQQLAVRMTQEELLKDELRSYREGFHVAMTLLTSLAPNSIPTNLVDLFNSAPPTTPLLSSDQTSIPISTSVNNS